eukprot:COSAG01_NODE_73571_length_242_cov_3.972028_1_plen_65_part_01
MKLSRCDSLYKLEVVRGTWATPMRLEAERRGRPLWFVSFWLNCKPSEPYLAKYLMEWKGLSEDQL